jgi:hypothetical protein
MKPPRSILDPLFRYTPSHETDLRRTFARVRREQAGLKKPKPQPLQLIELKARTK